MPGSEAEAADLLGAYLARSAGAALDTSEPSTGAQTGAHPGKVPW
jgi:hypothetical protein